MFITKREQVIHSNICIFKIMKIQNLKFIIYNNYDL